MSLVFALLQQDYIVFAADNRHTRGDIHGGYYNDAGIKTLEIMNCFALLGFAGHNFGEQIVFPARNKGVLDTGGRSLKKIATGLSRFARSAYSRFDGTDARPTVQIILAGWSEDYERQRIATSYVLDDRCRFSPTEITYPSRKFEIIGKSRHGALYGLHRFGNQDHLPLSAALKLAASLFAFSPLDAIFLIGNDATFKSNLG